MHWIRPRTVDQSNALHAICGDLSRQRDWPRGSGEMLDTEAWKRLLISAWERAHGRPAAMYPALDGAGFDVVYRRSSRLAKSEFSELLEFACAWAVENGVVLKERDAA